jgi:ferric-dicitrate binding protein FerR (iron transport regulator)
MNLLRRVALRVGQELARRPAARAKAAQVIAKTQRVMNDDVKPRAQQAWRDAQPEIQRAKSEIKRVAQEVREEYRKGRDGT